MPIKLYSNYDRRPVNDNYSYTLRDASSRDFSRHRRCVAKHIPEHFLVFAYHKVHDKIRSLLSKTIRSRFGFAENKQRFHQLQAQNHLA